MSWLTEALKTIDSRASNTIVGDYSRGLKDAKNIIMTACVNQAESEKPTVAKYPNPEDMK